MDGATFDRLARTFARRISRRKAVVAAGALAFAGSRSASANQLTPSTCGAAGDVCTMLMGCCDGLTCVTSAINTNYGVCVAGEGGTVSVGTTLISPFSENAEQEVAAIAASETATTTTTTVDPDVEREQQIAERKARRSTRRTTRDTRRSTNKTQQQDRREDRRLARDLRQGPRLELDLALSVAGDGPEVVRVRNRDDTSVYLMTIEPLLNPRESSGIEKSLAVDDSLFLLSDLPNGTETDVDEYLWIDRQVCTGSEEEGFLLTAGFSSFGESHEYVVMCDGAVLSGGNGKSRRKKRRRGQNNGKNRNRKGG